MGVLLGHYSPPTLYVTLSEPHFKEFPRLQLPRTQSWAQGLSTIGGLKRLLTDIHREKAT